MSVHIQILKVHLNLLIKIQNLKFGTLILKKKYKIVGHGPKIFVPSYTAGYAHMSVHIKILEAHLYRKIKFQI
jgi:hypothetical protein